MEIFVNNPVEEHARTLENRLSLLVAQRNLALSLPVEIINIFKKKLPSNPVLNATTLGRTKTSNIIREGIGKFVTEEIVEKLKNNFFSVIIDESTGINF